MKDIKISVIVPVYNREKFIGRCLRSLISQSIGINNFEIILVDDGSMIRQTKFIEAFSDEIRVIKHKKI